MISVTLNGRKSQCEQLVELKQGFTIGPWHVEPLTGDILGEGGSVHLEPKVMEVLVLLAERPGEVVERDDLLRRIWGARAAVSDEPLTRCIAELRRALGDSRQSPAFIQTIPKRGYRLLAPVAPFAKATSAPFTTAEPESTTDSVSAAEAASVPVDIAPPADRRATRPALLGGVFAIVVILAVLMLWALGRTANEPDEIEPIGSNTIAVLPFTDVGGSLESAYFGEGLADEILSRLNAVEGLHVVARTSSFSLRTAGEDVRNIGERLRVAHVLEGTVRRDGERLRIGVQLVDAGRGFQVWAESYDGVLGDIFALQDEIANGIVAKLRGTLPTELSTAPIATSAPTANLDAYELWLRGRQYLHRRDEEALRRSIRLFGQAIELDPGYGQAYVELAKAYALLPSYSTETQEEMFDQALATLAAGFERDPRLDDSMQGVLALIAYSRWDWISAEVAFRRALERSHNDPDLLVWYSQFLSAVGRTQASAEFARRAREVDLLSPVANHRLSVASMWIDEDADAWHYAQIAEELGMGPTANPDSFIVLQVRRGDYAAIRPLLIGVQTMFARPTEWVDPLLGAFASSAEKPQAIEAIARAAEARDIPRKYLFGAWVYLGETKRAVDVGLELVNDPPSFNVEFVFSREAQPLRRDPRFGELVRAIGLTRYWDQFGWPDACHKSGDDIACT